MNKLNDWLTACTQSWDKVAVGFVIGAAVGLFSHRLAIRRESRGRRLGFRAAVRKHIQKLEMFDTSQMSYGELWEIHQSSVPAISDACADIYDDIAWLRRERFKNVRIAYCNLTESEVEDYDEVSAQHLEEHGCVTVFPNYKKGVERLTELLELMIRDAK
jgi:hypothetical protein